MIVAVAASELWVALWLVMPWRCSPVNPEPAPGKPYAPKTDEVRAKRETFTEVKPAVSTRATLPEALVVRALDLGRAGFLHCFKKAAEFDPSQLSFKVRLHLEIDAAGVVTAASTDAGEPALANCLARIGYTLAFPAPRVPAVVDLPLLFKL
ncbi:MAG: hypothetical protein ABI867_04270 [Kofleriaceae bacterium]